MILVDTSVLIDFFKGAKTEGSIKFESVLQRGIPFGINSARLYMDCRKKGITIRSTIDCLIAETALENNLLLLHSDNDFNTMAKVIPLKFF